LDVETPDVLQTTEAATDNVAPAKNTDQPV